MPIIMVNERAASALSRIERALARIESTTIAPQRGGEVNLSYAQLERRHQTLRQELAHTLSDIDTLIAQSKTAQD
jgi:hypothetical protein